MKITKTQLKQIIKEELEEQGIVDKTAGMFGFERKKTPKSDRIYKLRDKFSDLRRAGDLKKLVDELLSDELGIAGAGTDLQQAVEGIYGALRDLSRLLLQASKDAKQREDAASE
tara:strand:- start:30 stop:371 length:342 start_codon:yes stop_codon:yes gene_type:complete